MPAYNNVYGNNMNNGNNFNNNGFANGYNGYNNNNFGLTPQEIIQYFQQGKLIWSDYVHGRAGADSYQMPPGINMVRLWDDENNRFYVKGYDNNGRPRVLDDNDFTEHIDPEPVNPSGIDLSAYATKDDIREMISNALSGIQIPNMQGYATMIDLNNALSNVQQPNMQGYVTQQEFNNALSRLAVGNGGRIVMNNEQDA